MYRSLLTGLCISIFAAGLPVAVYADQTGEPSAPAVVSTAVTSATEVNTTAANAAAASTAASSADAALEAAAAADAASMDSAGPTAGADLTMWNVPADAAQPAGPPPSRLSRLLHVQRFASGIAARGAAMAARLTRNALRFLGVPYSFGGTTSGGFDCSGYVQHVFAMMGRRVPRTADAQFAVAHRFTGTPKPGDLVFFQTYEPGPSHVGISLGGDRFVHASSSHGVTVSTLHDSYWAARYLGAKRIVE